MQFLIGADPEVFVSKNGAPYSAHGMIPGTKQKPFKVPYGAVQVDGMALEFNITPAKTEDQFVHNISSVFQKLQTMIPPEYKVDIKPSVNFDMRHLAEQPKVALELGCDPDYNAYNMAKNPAPNPNTNMRTAAGHIHIGWCKGADVTDQDHLNACAKLVRELDFTLGMPSIILDPDKERRKLYGKAGAFRPKPYGVEYRVLSNFWLKSPELMKWVYQTTQDTIKHLLNKDCLYNSWGTHAQRTINGEGGYTIEYWKTYMMPNYPRFLDIWDSFQHLMEKPA